MGSGRVVGGVESARVLERDLLQVRHVADGGPGVRVPLAEEHLVQPLVGHAVGAVLVGLLALVHHHPALHLKHLAGEHGKEEAHAVALQPERQLHRVRGHGLVVVGAVQPGGAVVGAAHALQQVVELPLGRVERALEHQVLEEMGQPGAAGRLVAAAHAVHQVHGHDRRRAVLVADDAHPVAQRERAHGKAQRGSGCGGVGHVVRRFGRGFGRSGRGRVRKSRARESNTRAAELQCVGGRM